MSEPKRPNPALGIMRVALGQVDGLAQFGGTVQSFLSSLAPLIAFPVAGSLIELVRDGVMTALATLLLGLILQLAPQVISHALAVRWQREDRWLHYATAYNWSFWALPLFAVAMTVAFGVAIGMGMPDWMAANGWMIGLGLYSLWLHWFVGRNALELSRLKAGLLVVLVNAGTLLLVLGPAQLG